MKKRVAVYSERLPHVLRVIRALPLFAFHRQDWDVLRPFVVRHANRLKPEKFEFASFQTQTLTTPNFALQIQNSIGKSEPERSRGL